MANSFESAPALKGQEGRAEIRRTEMVFDSGGRAPGESVEGPSRAELLSARRNELLAARDKVLEDKKRKIAEKYAKMSGELSAGDLAAQMNAEIAAADEALMEGIDRGMAEYEATLSTKQ